TVRTVTAVQPAAPRVPIFCVAAPRVNSLGYVRLGRHLGPDQPLFVLQSQYRSNRDRPYSREEVRALACESIRAMRTVCPSGPYAIAGMCEGAHFAFEMARQLQAEGEEVPLLATLDAWPEENTRTRFGWWLHMLQWEYRRLAHARWVGLGPSALRMARGTLRNVRDWALSPFFPPA